MIIIFFNQYLKETTPILIANQSCCHILIANFLSTQSSFIIGDQLIVPCDFSVCNSDYRLFVHLAGLASILSTLSHRPDLDAALEVLEEI